MGSHFFIVFSLSEFCFRVDWNAEQPEVVADSPPAAAPTTLVPTKPPSAKPTTAPAKAVPVASTTTETTTTSTASGDAELEKRKLRAARFGIPLVEAKQKNINQPPQKSASGMVRGFLLLSTLFTC
jgi:hypothetical protein